jgi:hypothetical protein
VDARLRIKKVRERLYRGYCVPEADLAAAFALLQERREAIYALYRDDVGRLLEPRVVKETLAYFDQFYETIGDPRAAKRHITEACIGNG